MILFPHNQHSFQLVFSSLANPELPFSPITYPRIFSSISPHHHPLFTFPSNEKKNLPAMRSHLAFSQLSLDCRRSSSYSLSFFPVTFLILHSFLPCFLKRECFGETRKSVVKKLAANLRFIGSILSLPDLDEGGNESRRSLPLSSSLLFDRVYFPYPF